MGLRGRSAGSDPDKASIVEPGSIEFRSIFDMMRFRAGGMADLRKSPRVPRVLTPHYDHDIRLAREGCGRTLPLARCGADGVHDAKLAYQGCEGCHHSREIRGRLGRLHDNAHALAKRKSV